MPELPAVEQHIFFHVGLGKAASTYLQYAFFPQLRGLRYLQRTRYRQAPRWLSSQGPGRYLISREFDQQLERECRWFRDQVQAQSRPDCPVRITPVIVLRRQDSWFASQYRRHIKNGSPLLFHEFIDPQADAGLWKLEDGLYEPKLRFLRTCFGTEPLLFFYEDLRRDPALFLGRMAAALGAQAPQRLKLDAVHTSYSEHQLLIMRAASRRLFPSPIAHGRISWLGRRLRLLACYAVLYSARLLPASAGDPAPLIPAAELSRLREYYRADWEAVGGQP
jgi:hypothetical protein